MNTILEIDRLTIDYHGEERTVRAVDAVSLQMQSGEILGLAGESGSGKSTVAHAVMRLLSDSAQIVEGSIRFAGTDVVSLDRRELRAWRWNDVAMVFQSAMNSLNPLMRVGDQIVDVLRAHTAMSRSQARARTAELLEGVRIPPDRMRSYPHQLSGGQRQRVVIAMACALEPRLLILDEPTTALDVVVQQEILAQIRELQESLGFAVLFITHDMSLMLELSDRIGVMYRGRLVELAPATAMRTDSQHPYTRALMNAFPPMTGPRVPLTGLAEGTRFVDIGDLEAVAPGHLVAPSRTVDTADEHSENEVPA
ncbi:ABC transporter ATP-binding protein [Nesterenkonia sp. PF2B19]|uniref:ABC transporter ATP-binding protein n=1 Tax=unclassified Nesterenkonia TaxID=2629769 RepID=UPI0008722302|nr:ABC transporter ATP-binding protein [Nesterenkonia sp. PF2B19]OSM42723.1 sugar ABC transporter ATP-binding protein [Nesterenkonia sp. PF2B19]